MTISSTQTNTSNMNTIYKFAFTEKQLDTIKDMIRTYKDFESELYNYPPEETLFTQTQRNLFELFEID